MHSIIATIAAELAARPEQISAAVDLLDEGATVPFIARYRKEVTGGLDDTQLRNLEERLGYLRELEARREVILKSVGEQGNLTPELEALIRGADNKTRLEDLYLPYKPKRRTKGEIAKEQGLEPLADGLLENLDLNPEEYAAAFVTDEVADVKAALDGAKFILMERFAEDATLLATVRQHIQEHGHLEARVIAGKEEEGVKYRDYFEHTELALNTPSHRVLAMLRGRNEGVLQLGVNPDPGQESCGEQMIGAHIGWRFANRAADNWMQSVVQWTWKIKVLPAMSTELISTLRQNAEHEAIDVFARNISDVLMAAPAGAQVTMGIDPGIRTGCKVAVVDATGKLLDTATIYPHPPKRQWTQAQAVLAQMAVKHQVNLVAIGNGTASRETEKLVAELIADKPDLGLNKVMVSEAGASVYSASALAAEEFPDLDVSIRGAVSIARRVQDPLAELVKIEPKAIGVGQYQHDVSQTALAKSLDAVVEDCVNAVGVDLNTASVPLLTRVSGLNATLASNIVQYRDAQGGFKNRNELKKVTRLGPKAFEQCAGFLKIAQGDNPLDASAVHPEAYPLVKRILTETNKAVEELINNKSLLSSLNPELFIDEQFGLPTVKDILQELEKPGRDPRPEFKTASFREGVETLNDLREGMVLEGVVTNVTNFGAFVDIGVHQDGLVHISALANRYVSSPSDVVKAGDIVTVKVVEVDTARKRIALTMRLEDEVKPQAKKKPERKKAVRKPKKVSPQTNNAMASAWAEALSRQSN
jgi:protein Tex